MTASLEIVANAVTRWLREVPRPLILGICGAQGSGKSTLADGLVDWARAHGLTGAALSLDDLYVGKAARAELARDVHPLMTTRGVPLTHDVVRGCAILDAAKAGAGIELPRFDKASDEPQAAVEPIAGALDLLIFEGWCLGATAQHDDELAQPVNALERDEDRAGRWRRAINDALAGPYQALFGRIDRLVLLAAPGFEVVQQWRTQQERDLRDRLRSEGRDPSPAMSDEQIERFIAHYERITRAILRDLPGRADLTLNLDSERRVMPEHSLLANSNSEKDNQPTSESGWHA